MRKQLTPENVSYLVVHPSDSTIREDLTTEDIKLRRESEGYPDIGYHFVITRDGVTHDGVYLNEAGTHTAQYDDKAIGILIIGGRTTRGKPSDNYTKEQKASLKELLEELLAVYSNSEAVGIGELWGGQSPHISIKGLLNGPEI